MTFSQELGVAVFILIGIAVAWLLISAYRARRKRLKAEKRAALVRAISVHPAGRNWGAARAATRPETPGFDWANDTSL